MTLTIRKRCILEKWPGKGGWTFARVPEIPPDKKAPFGWVKVKGRIDSFELKQYRLMPMGDGTLFLPVRAEIRKKIGKKAGDFVHVELSLDNDPVEIPEELALCLMEDPAAKRVFLKLPDGAQQNYIKWIYSTKTEAGRVERIAKVLNELVAGT